MTSLLITTAKVHSARRALPRAGCDYGNSRPASTPDTAGNGRHERGDAAVSRAIASFSPELGRENCFYTEWQSSRCCDEGGRGNCGPFQTVLVERGSRCTGENNRMLH